MTDAPFSTTVAWSIDAQGEHRRGLPSDKVPHVLIADATMGEDYALPSLA
jgi:hypothetical protein